MTASEKVRGEQIPRDFMHMWNRINEPDKRKKDTDSSLERKTGGSAGEMGLEMGEAGEGIKRTLVPMSPEERTALWSHCIAHLKLTQHCTPTMLAFK